MAKAKKTDDTASIVARINNLTGANKNERKIASDLIAKVRTFAKGARETIMAALRSKATQLSALRTKLAEQISTHLFKAHAALMALITQDALKA